MRTTRDLSRGLTADRCRQASRGRPLPTRNLGRHLRATKAVGYRTMEKKVWATYLEGDAKVATVGIRNLFPDLALPCAT